MTADEGMEVFRLFVKMVTPLVLKKVGLLSDKRFVIYKTAENISQVEVCHDIFINVLSLFLFWVCFDYWSQLIFKLIFMST